MNQVFPCLLTDISQWCQPEINYKSLERKRTMSAKIGNHIGDAL